MDQRFDTDLVISGAGPAGLLLAIELCLAGVTPVVLERLPAISEIPRGNGLFGQIVPMLDFRGLLEPLRAQATYAGPVPGFAFGPVQLDFGGLGTSPLDVLAIPQRKLEQFLEQRLTELGGTVTRGHEITALTPGQEAITLEVRGPDGGYQLRTRFLAGCDGAHSLVRKQAGIGFPGFTSAQVSKMGRVRVPAGMIVSGTREIDVPGFGRLQPMQTVTTPTGRYSIGPMAALDADAPDDAYIVATWEDEPGAADAALTSPELTPAQHASATHTQAELTLAELQASLNRVLGAELPLSEPIWLSRVVGNSRQADRYVAGQIVLAGDAAHVFGLGGSLNSGLTDALNLGWKLAAEVSGHAPAGLLASYHTERHAAGQRTLLHARAQHALSARGEAADALRELFTEVTKLPGVARHLGQLIQGSDVRYEMPGSGGHPLAGRLAPDLRLITSDGSVRVAELMRAARPVLVDFTPDGRVAMAAAAGSSHVSCLRAELGTRPADALLIRPDGYVAWASGPDAADPVRGVAEAMATWFGSITQDAAGT